MVSVYYFEVNMICIIILLMIYIAVRGAKGDYRMSMFRLLLVATSLLCLTDLIAGVMRGKQFYGARTILWTVNIIYFLCGLSIGVIWVAFSMYLLHEELNRLILYILMIFAVIDGVLFIISPFTKLCFYLDENNIYHRGPILWIQWMILIPCMIIPSVVAFLKKTSSRESRVIAAFAIFPFATYMLQICVYGISVTQVGMTLGIVMFYIFFQAQVVNEAKMKAQMFDEMSNTDELTKLKNRRAYENRLDELVAQEWVGVLFVDLNGLKIENDSKGHAAGDRLINRFADSVRDCFSDDEIFRISGDEFVVLSVDKNHYYLFCDKLVYNVGDSASIGMCEGDGKDILSIVNQAEKHMYRKKSEYYRKSGLERRRS